MPPIPFVGHSVATTFIQSAAVKASPLRSALDALAASPSDPRVTRKAYSAIRVAVAGQLAGKADYDTIQSIAQDTALCILKAAANGAQLTVALVRECASNLHKNHVRDTKRQRRDGSAYTYIPEDSVEIKAADNAWDAVEAAEATSDMLQKLATLPWEIGNVLALRFLEDQTLQQVADQLGLSLSKVHRLEKKGLKQMESLMAA